MQVRYEKHRTEIWGHDAHPAKGKAQPPRKPIDRKGFMRSNLKAEFGKVAVRCGIPARLADREDMTILDILAQQLRMYVWAAYLIRPEIMPGMSLGETLDVTTDMLYAETERRRLSQLAASGQR